MISQSQEKDESLFGVGCFSQLGGSSPEGSQGASVHKGEPKVSGLVAASPPQSLALDEGLQFAAALLQEHLVETDRLGSLAGETEPSTPPKTARPSRRRDGTDRGPTSQPTPLHIRSKWSTSKSRSSTAAQAFHSTGLAAVTAAVAAASATGTAAADVTGTRGGNLGGPSPSRFWLGPSEFSLLAEIRARANEATATQIRAAAEAAAAAFRGKVPTSPAVDAAGVSESDSTHTTLIGHPYSSTSGDPGDSSPVSAPGSSSQGPSSSPLPVAAASPHIDEARGSLPCNEDRGDVMGISDEGAAPGLEEGPWLVHGTWTEAESQGGPQGTAWRVYTPDAAEISSSFSSSSSGALREVGGEELIDEEVDVLPPTQRTDGDGPSAAPAAAGGDAEESCLEPEAAASSRPSSADVAAAYGSNAIVSVSPAAEESGLQSSAILTGSAAVAAPEAAAAAASQTAFPTSQVAGAADVADGECIDEQREEVVFSLPAVNEGPRSCQGFFSEPSTPQRPQMAASAPPTISPARTPAAASIGPAAGIPATLPDHCGGRGASADVSPYVTRAQGTREPSGGPPSGPCTPCSASSSSSRRGRLKSTARLAASSLRRAAVEATARRFSRLPLGGEGVGSFKVWTPSPLKKQKANDYSQLGAHEGACNSSGDTSNSTSRREPSGNIAAEPERHEVSRIQVSIKRERRADSSESQGQSSAIPAPQEVPRGEASVDSGIRLEDWEDETVAPGSFRCEADAGRTVDSVGPYSYSGSHNQLLRVPVHKRQLEEIMDKGLYAFQVEGLLWMLYREGRLFTEGEPSSHSQGLNTHLSGGALPIGSPPCGGGILADDPGLGKTIQMISLIATSLPPSQPGASSGAYQPATAQQQRVGEERRSLVLAPASLIPQWEAEIHRVCGMSLGVLNVPRRLRETGSLLIPSMLQGIQVVLVSYEALISIPCLCSSSRPRKDNQRRRQQMTRVKVQPSTQGGNHLSGQEEDPFFAVIESSPSSGASDAEVKQQGSPQRLAPSTPATPGSSPRHSGRSCDLGGLLHRFTSHSTFQRKLPNACTPHSRRVDSVGWPCRAQTEAASSHAVSTTQTLRRNPMTLWGPRGPRCSCVRCYLVGFEWERIVLDEAHLALRRRRVSRAIQAISALYRWGLTATPGPAEDNRARDPAGDPSNLLQLLGFLKAGDDAAKTINGEERSTMMTETCCCASMPADAACSGQSAGGDHGILVLRRTHGDLKRREQEGEQVCYAVKALLRKMKIRIPTKHPVLPTVQLKLHVLSFVFPHELVLYRRIEQMAGRELALADREATTSAANALEWITRLRQACLHYSLVLGENTEIGNKSYSYIGPTGLSQCMGSPFQRRRMLSVRSPGHQLGTQTDTEALQEQVGVTTTLLTPGETGPTQSTKTQAIISAVASILQNNPNAKIVILSAFTSFLKLLELHLAKFFRGKYSTDQDIANRVLKITGEDRVANRLRIVRQFAKERHVNIMLVSTLSASHGVDGLQSAGHLLICEPIMTLGRVRQVLGRLNRIGQSEEQVSVQMFFVGNSIEHRILQVRSPVELADSQFVVSDDGTPLSSDLLLRQSSRQSKNRLVLPNDTSFLLGLE